MTETLPTQAHYLVVRNHEHQYALWQADLPLPAGWTSQGGPAGREECLQEIERLWTDMTPKSLRFGAP